MLVVDDTLTSVTPGLRNTVSPPASHPDARRMVGCLARPFEPRDFAAKCCHEVREFGGVGIYVARAALPSPIMERIRVTHLAVQTIR